MRVELTVEEYTKRTNEANERRMAPVKTFRPLESLECTRHKKKTESKNVMYKYYDIIDTLKPGVLYKLKEIVECNKDLHISRRCLLKMLAQYAADRDLIFTKYKNSGTFLLERRTQ